MHEIAKVSPGPPATGARRWICLIVMAVVMGEAIWAFLVSVTNDLALPAVARIVGVTQSVSFQRKADFNIQALFGSVIELCLAGLVAVLLNSWSQKAGSGRPEPVKAAPVAARATAPIIVTPATQPASAAAPAGAGSAPATQVQSLSPPAPPPPTKPAEPKPRKEVYYNIVGEPVDTDDE
jgi:hypothetical protein